jgi:hypothetical protein
MSNRRAGIIEVKVNGILHDAKGNFTYNLGKPKREAIVGADSVHGFKETPQVAFVEGELTDASTFDLKTLVEQTDVTVTLNLNNGKVIEFRQAWYAADGNVQTEEGNIQVRFEAKDAEEIKP